MSNEQFLELIKAIEELGYDRETAGRYAARIGDTPVKDSEGKICVMEGTVVVARLKLDFFEETE